MSLLEFFLRPPLNETETLDIRNSLMNAGFVDLTPSKLVAELDRYIIGQSNAKKRIALSISKIDIRK